MTSLAASLPQPGLRWRPTYWYSDPFVISGTSTSPVANLTMYAPLFVPHRVAISEVAAFCGAIGDDTMSVRLYRVSDDQIVAWAVTDSVSIAAESIGVASAPLPRQPVILWPGLYFVSVRFVVAEGTSTWRFAALAGNMPVLGAPATLAITRIVRCTSSAEPGDVVEIKSLTPEGAVPYWVGVMRS